MSWIERIKNELVITTGEGTEFRPSWMNAVKKKDYNVSEFTFPGVSGSLVTRLKSRGRRYGLEIYFQGEDTIDQANAFETGADDPRAWVLSHPLYDRIVVQPLSLEIDNSQLNVSKFVISVIETIQEDNPVTNESPVDKITADQANNSDEISLDYAEGIELKAADVNQMTTVNNQLFSIGKKIATNDVDYENYFNLFNTANTEILNATSDPLASIRTMQAVINAPALFSIGVKDRINTFVDQIDLLGTSVVNLVTPNSKKLYESNTGGLIGALSLAMVSNAVYTNRDEVILAMDQLNTSYESYLTDLENIQTDNYSSNESYIPSFDSQRGLNDLVNYTISRMFDIVLDARQERFIILEDDSNIIELAHRFYGLDVEDSTIDEFQESNDIGLSEILGIKKGRTVVYYV